MNEQQKNRLMMMASGSSVATTVILLVLKMSAFWLTGSIAILSSLFDSIQDFMTSLVNMIAVRQAIQPADKSHRFGHGKAQGIGCLIQAFIIAVSAVLLLIESVIRLCHPQEVAHIGIGVWVVLFSIILTCILLHFQRYVIATTGSLSIKADQAHYTGDIAMNVGVMCSLGASGYLEWLWVDGVFGIVVSCYLLYVVLHVMKEACAMLMDKELSHDIRDNIRRLALSVPLVKNISHLRTREGGNKQFVQFNVQFDGDVSLNTAHTQLDLIEQKVYDKYPAMDIIIHAEPYDERKRRHKKE